jgi:hypothetical protein
MNQDKYLLPQWNLSSIWTRTVPRLTALLSVIGTKRFLQLKNLSEYDFRCLSNGNWDYVLKEVKKIIMDNTSTQEKTIDDTSSQENTMDNTSTQEIIVGMEL